MSRKNILFKVYSNPFVYLMLDIISGNTTQEIHSDIKEETVTIKEEGSTAEDTCTVYVQGESMKMKSKKNAFISLSFSNAKNIIISII